ncbi:MAG: methyltransferase, partial [Gammaproteobacteria bacterium]|nr:methyltransferase [Gammaproteobacteria bacterium]
LPTDKRRSQARHTDSLPFGQLLRKAAELLDEQGVFSVILPRPEAEYLLQLAITQGWYLAQRCEVRSKAEKPLQRLLLSLSLKPQLTQHSSLTIQQADGSYSAEYKTLLRDFYLKF